MKISVIGAPTCWGASRSGAQLAPAQLRNSGLIQELTALGHEVEDRGDVTVAAEAPGDPCQGEGSCKNLTAILETGEALAEAVASILEAGRFPLTLGGDHSLALGSLAGAAAGDQRLAVIWMDAHGDLNTPETTPSGNVHGMPLAAALGLGHSAMVHLGFPGAKVQAEDVLLLGVRDLDPGERALIRDLGLKRIRVEDVRNKGLPAAVDQLTDFLAKRKGARVHLSLDIDALDAALVPGTGTPVVGGFSLEETTTLLGALAASRRITSLDLVELNVELDRDQVTCQLCLDLMRGFFSAGLS